MLVYAPTEGGPSIKELDERAMRHGEAIRKILVEGAKNQGGWHTYVNYAHGGETLEEIYGKEPWRIEKLKSLKQEYDPRNLFKYYAPLVATEESQEGHSEL